MHRLLCRLFARTGSLALLRASGQSRQSAGAECRVRADPGQSGFLSVRRREGDGRRLLRGEAVRYFIHSSNIGNYPEGAVREFDRQALLNQFDQIRRSLILGQ